MSPVVSLCHFSSHSQRKNLRTFTAQHWILFSDKSASYLFTFESTPIKFFLISSAFAVASLFYLLNLVRI